MIAVLIFASSSCNVVQSVALGNCYANIHEQFDFVIVLNNLQIVVLLHSPQIRLHVYLFRFEIQTHIYSTMYDNEEGLQRGGY